MDCHLASVQSLGTRTGIKDSARGAPNHCNGNDTGIARRELLATQWRPTIAASAAEQYRRCCRVGRPGPHR